MSWTQETVIKLIKAFRKQDILWDPKDPNYFNKILKGHAWTEIAQELDMPVMAVKSKVEILSGQIRREKGRLIRMSKQGVHVSSSWYAYEHLKFLLNRKTRKRVGNEDTNDNSEIQDSQVPQTNNLLKESTSKRPTEKVLIPKKKNKHTENRMTKSDMDTDSRMTKTAYSLLPSTSNTVTDVLAKSATDSSATHADQIYANFIATKFRTYSQRTKNVLQYKISNLLYQADTGRFDDDQAYATPQQETRGSRTASRYHRANEYDSPSSSPENKSTRRTSSEDRTPITLKIEDISDSEDPLNDDYKVLVTIPT